ncbi:hypothetical protein BCR36DRAFT_365405 [Piromyces finnis]|uniref:Phospholipid/glycerol acyltransferase domain-containing protein n=1 Tax=Piromyces finnis TaxID=1754191 RepID=A0A1Y1VN13_9FUNG|nr:hypothetical protein BCR36DRAFT_365405 [Piromyces finnis]|eukprot:ORX60816.1 hypothetical protein BCR36DRAFT_365405 [Piromyces finnis]
MSEPNPEKIPIPTFYETFSLRFGKSNSQVEEDVDVFSLDTAAFIEKYDANTKDLNKRKSKIIAKRLHMESICIYSKVDPWPWYKYVEYGLMSTFIMPIRAVISSLTVACCWSLMTPARLFENLEKKYIENPESEHYGKKVHRIPKPKWRRIMIDVLTRTASKITLFMGLGFYNIKVKDLRKKDKNGKPITSPLIISNHNSLVDVLGIIAYYDTTPSFLAMKWVDNTPFIGSIANAMQCVFVESNKRNNLTEEIKLRSKESLHYDLPPLTIFPEGTTTNGDYLIDFKYGAFYPHFPVQPIAIKYKYKYYNPSFVIDNIVQYALKTAMQFRNDMEIIILPVIEPETEEEKTDVKVWTEKNYKV